MSASLTIVYRLDAPALEFYAGFGIDRAAAIALVTEVLRALYPAATLDVDTTTGWGRCDVTRIDAEGDEVWQDGDDDVDARVAETVSRRIEQREAARS